MAFSLVDNSEYAISMHLQPFDSIHIFATDVKYLRPFLNT